MEFEECRMYWNTVCLIGLVLGVRWCEREGYVVDGNVKKIYGSFIMKCFEVSLDFIIYCNGELLKVFKEGSDILICIF